MKCSDCGKVAARICSECGLFYCESHMRGHICFKPDLYCRHTSILPTEQLNLDIASFIETTITNLQNEYRLLT